MLTYSENSEKSTQDRVELMASRMSDLGMEQNRHHPGKEPRARVSPNRGDIVTWIWDDASWICTIHEFNTKELSFPSETQQLPTIATILETGQSDHQPAKKRGHSNPCPKDRPCVKTELDDKFVKALEAAARASCPGLTEAKNDLTDSFFSILDSIEYPEAPDRMSETEPIGPPQNHDRTLHPPEVFKPPDISFGKTASSSDSVLRSPDGLPPGALRPPDPVQKSDRSPNQAFVEDPPPAGKNPQESLRPPDKQSFKTHILSSLSSLKARFNPRRHEPRNVPQETTPKQPQPPITGPSKQTDTESRSPWPQKLKGCLHPPSKGQKSDSRSRRFLRKMASKFGLPALNRKSNDPGASSFNSSLRKDVNSQSTASKSSGTAISSSSSLYENDQERLLDINIDALKSLTPPQPFQCTFCLLQCTSKQNWIEHEKNDHLQRREWENTSTFSGRRYGRTGRTTSNFSQNTPASCSSRAESGSVCDDHWFWYCGFCEQVLRDWDERQEHIEEHFNAGTTMTSWDPIKSPYPWRRGSITPPVPSGWNLAELRDIQQPCLTDLISAIGKPKQYPCKICGLQFENSKILKDHMDLWHKGRPSWSCSSLTNDLNPDWFFSDYSYPEEQDKSDGNVDPDELSQGFRCYCCGEYVDYDLDGSDPRLSHLRDEHNFENDSCDQICFSDGQFSLHLANNHNLGVDFVKPFMKLCKKRYTPALMIEETT